MKIIQVLLTLVLTSFFFFPFYTTFLPAINTKMIVAALGGILLLQRHFFSVVMGCFGVFSQSDVNGVKQYSG